MRLPSREPITLPARLDVTYGNLVVRRAFRKNVGDSLVSIPELNLTDFNMTWIGSDSYLSDTPFLGTDSGSYFAHRSNGDVVVYSNGYVVLGNTAALGKRRFYRLSRVGGVLSCHIDGVLVGSISFADVWTLKYLQGGMADTMKYSTGVMANFRVTSTVPVRYYPLDNDLVIDYISAEHGSILGTSNWDETGVVVAGAYWLGVESIRVERSLLEWLDYNGAVFYDIDEPFKYDVDNYFYW
jgi:hypothetical protein